MQQLTFTGWRVGMQKVAFTRLLHHEAGLGLKQAQQVMLRVLDEQPVTVEVADGLANRLLASAEALGVTCHLAPLPEAS